MHIKSITGRSCLSLAALALLTTGLLSGCSDNGIENGGTDPIVPDVVKENVTVGNNPEEQADRITFYGDAQTPKMGTRAAEDFPSVGSAPEVPADAPVFSTPNEAQQSQDNGKNTAYVLTDGQGQIELYGGDVYIVGEVSTHNFNGKKGTVYVMPGSKLTLTGNVQNVTIKAYGELLTGQNDITLGWGSEILVKDNFQVNGRFAVEGTCVVNGDLTVTGQLQMNLNSKVKANCIDVQSDKEQAINIAGELAVRSHLHAYGLYMNGGSVYLWPNAMAEIEGTTWFSQWNGGLYYYTSEGKTDGHALLKTTTLRANGAEYFYYVSPLFANNLKVSYENQINLNGLSSADDYYIPSDVNNGGCNPGNGHNTPWFDPIAVIEGPTHEHTHLSATCVQPAGDKAYVSYHLNEAYEDIQDEAATSNHQGCVEMFDVSESKAQITSWLINEDHDFNHLIVDNGKMFTAGDTKNGATLGIINLEADGSFGQQSTSMETVQLNGTSGNCIIADGSKFRIATSSGFQSVDKSTYADTDDFVETSGSGKHIATASGVTATLNLDQKGVTASTATVSVYKNGWGEPVSFSVGEITPIDGKNVILIDDGYIYVCLGENGIAKYDLNGNLQTSYNWITEHPDSKGKPCANGIAADDSYLYVAYGGAGLLVFDKDLNRVARHYQPEYSANYTAVVNGLIYVAYGRNGLEVLKMNMPAE